MVLLDKYLTHLTNLKGELTEKDGNLSEVSGAARIQDKTLISDMLGYTIILVLINPGNMEEV